MRKSNFHNSFKRNYYCLTEATSLHRRGHPIAFYFHINQKKYCVRLCGASRRHLFVRCSSSSPQKNTTYMVTHDRNSFLFLICLRRKKFNKNCKKHVMALCMMKSINCTLFVFMIFIVVVDDVFPLSRSCIYCFLLVPYCKLCISFFIFFFLPFSLFLLFY